MVGEYIKDGEYEDSTSNYDQETLEIMVIGTLEIMELADYQVLPFATPNYTLDQEETVNERCELVQQKGIYLYVYTGSLKYFLW